MSLHSCACQTQSSANDVPSHALQHVLSLKGLVGSCPNLEKSKMWTPERGSRCSAEFSRQQYLDESPSADDEGVPCSRVLVDSPSLSCVASERGVLCPCALSLFDLLISGGEDAASSSGRKSCARDSLASSAVSDGSEEEVVGFDNLPGEPWKVSLPQQRTSSPSRVEQVLPSPPGLPAPPSMFTMAAPGSLAKGVWWRLGNQTRDTVREHCKVDQKNTARTIHWCTHPSTLQTRAGDTSQSLFKCGERSLLQYRCSASTRSLPVFLLCWVCLSIVENALGTHHSLNRPFFTWS